MPIEISTSDGLLSIESYGLTPEQDAFVERHLKDNTYHARAPMDWVALVQKLISENEENWNLVRNGAREGAFFAAVGGGLLGGTVGAVVAGPPGAGVGFVLGAAGAAPIGAAVGSGLVINKNYSSWVKKAEKEGMLKDFRDLVLTPMIDSQVDSPLGKYICGITLFLPSLQAILPCEHRFHLPELLKALDMKSSCPTCLREFTKRDVKPDHEGMDKINDVTQRKIEEIIKSCDVSNKNHKKWLMFKEGLEAIIQDIKDKKRADIKAIFDSVAKEAESYGDAIDALSSREVVPEKKAQEKKAGKEEPKNKLPSPLQTLLRARRCREEEEEAKAKAAVGSCREEEKPKAQRKLNFDSSTVVVN